MKMRINTKLLTFILTSTITVYIIAIGYLSFNLRKMAMDDATKLADSYAMQYANEIKGEFNVDIGISRAMAYSFSGIKDMEFNTKYEVFQKTMGSIFKSTGDYSIVWTSFELNSFGENYYKNYGRLRSSTYFDNGEIKHRADSVNIDGDIIGSQYYDIKLSKLETVDEPYMFSLTGNKDEEILTTSICVPLLDNNNKYMGISGVDFQLERTQSIVDRIKTFKESQSYLIAYNGKFVSHPDKNMYNKAFSEIEPEINEIYKVTEKIQNGDAFSFISKNVSGENLYFSFAPIQIGESITPWSLAIVVPVNIIMEEANKVYHTSLLVGIIGLLIITFIAWRISRNISVPLIRTTGILKKLDKGIIDKDNKLSIKSQDEVGEIASSVNNLIEGLNSTAEFARQVGQGNLNAEFKLLSDQDVLGKALLDMRDSLRIAKEEDEKRQIEDKEINWTTDGLAKFGEILRFNVEDMEEFGYSIISNLIKYMGANQGAIYLINDDDQRDKHIEMTAAYAYERRKFADARIEFEEGLIGQCILEQESIHLTEIPDSYLEITSGLGHANPKSLLLVPLKFNEQVYGALEIASFENFEDHQIAFTEKIGESIASTISTIKINVRTAKLLEESKEKSEKMAMQEEEIRQNMEEMQATQEEMSRKIEKLEKKKEELSKALEEKTKQLEDLKKK